MPYDVPLRVLSITPTRDGTVNPSNRLPDKHVRLMHGKTLDEWTMLQLWSSKYISRAEFVCETEEHAARLKPMADRYDIGLMVRPREMLHPINDSGALPLFYAVMQVLHEDYYSLLVTPFVITPLRPPGFFDHMVEQYLLLMDNPDQTTLQPLLVGGWRDPARTQWREIHGGKRTEPMSSYSFCPGTIEGTGWWESSQQHWVTATWAYVARAIWDFTRPEASILRPAYFEIPEWTDIHIDTEEQWGMAEYFFKKKILSQGEDCYERYRASWEEADDAELG